MSQLILIILVLDLRRLDVTQTKEILMLPSEEDLRKCKLERIEN
jgi:hypothetical protein